MIPRIYLALITFCFSCSQKTETTEAMNSQIRPVTVTDFGKLPDGNTNRLYTMINKNGVEMRVMNYGGIITHLFVPDRDGKMEDVVLGYDSLKGYVDNNPYFGSLIGRFGNRIAKGKFSLDDKEYSLAVNNGPNHLHGGIKGFHAVYWNIDEGNFDRGPSLKLTYTSNDGEEGYPGTLSVEVTYTLTDSNELEIEYNATTDKKTVINLTQHSYFNLSSLKSDILNHELTLNADNFLPVDETLIPSGQLMSVKKTPFDFTSPKKIGDRINHAHEQLKFGNGYDHCWVLNRKGNDLSHAATLYDSASGREMSVYTTEPGIQFYSGNFLYGSITGKAGVKYNFRTGLCLETQHFPDSPNKPEFPTVVLHPGEKYESRTVYRFAVRK